MRFAVVPGHLRHDVAGGRDEVVVWVGALGLGVSPMPDEAWLELGDARARVTWPHSFEGRVYTDEVAMPAPEARSEVRLVVGGATVATATVGAPPRSLPGPGERPYTVLVGSCYCASNDRGARVAKTAAAMARAGAQPDVTFLCGDQVYVDTPPNYSWTAHPREELVEKFLGEYLKSWSDTGLLPLLRMGATYLTSDDHEFWNEYPAKRGHGGRNDDWESVTRALFRTFQRRREPPPFEAGEVSFFALDTRLDRDERLEDFSPPSRLAEVERWLEGLSGPGVLVLGETFFGELRSAGASLTRLMGGLIAQPTIEGTLLEYAQYRRLASALARSGKTVVLVAGDVHWGRLAECRLDNGTRLLEVVSSPLTLVDSGLSRLGRPWTKAPSPFEAGGLRGEVRTLDDPSGRPYRVEHDHFCTLEFSRAPGGVRMAVRHWRVGDERTGDVVHDTVL